MHEMSIAQSILELAVEEAKKLECSSITLIRVDYGALAGIMPDALKFCFEALVAGTEFEKTALELREIPLELRCPMCGSQFEGSQSAMFAPCPHCGELTGFKVEHGTELILSHLEAIK